MDREIVVETTTADEKEHSVRYNSESVAVPSIYIKKSALKAVFGRLPGNVVITITEKEE